MCMIVYDCVCVCVSVCRVSVSCQCVVSVCRVSVSCQCVVSVCVSCLCVCRVCVCVVSVSVSCMSVCRAVPCVVVPCRVVSCRICLPVRACASTFCICVLDWVPNFIFLLLALGYSSYVLLSVIREVTTRLLLHFFNKQPVNKQPRAQIFENNNRIQWSIIMLNNGEQNKF